MRAILYIQYVYCWTLIYDKEHGSQDSLYHYRRIMTTPHLEKDQRKKRLNEKDST